MKLRPLFPVPPFRSPLLRALVPLLAAGSTAGCRIDYEILDGNGLGWAGDPAGGTSGGGGTANTGGSGAATGGTASSTGGNNTGSSGNTGGGGTGGDSGGSGGTGMGGMGMGGMGMGGMGMGGGDGCTPTNGSIEACDGLDNDCNGEVDETDPCAADCFGASLDGRGYMFCSGALVFADAQAYCAASSMSLARIDDADENEWIRATAFAVPEIAAFFAVLIGATDQSVEGTWRWLDGEQFWSGASDGSPVDGLYTNWNPGEPNNQGSGEHCAGVRSFGAWSDIRCSGGGAEMPFVCEAP